MKGLYRGRYLIAVYNDDDILIDVGCRPCELNLFTSKEVKKSVVSRIFNLKTNNPFYHKNTKYKMHFLDMSVQQDVFEEEDKMFLNFIQKVNLTNKEKTKQLGVSESTLYRSKNKK